MDEAEAEAGDAVMTANPAVPELCLVIPAPPACPVGIQVDIFYIHTASPTVYTLDIAYRKYIE